MGKTNPTYRDRVQAQHSDWRRMRKALRRHQQPAFDRLWEHAENHADAAGIGNPRDPMDGIFLSICLGQQREIQRLEDELEELKEESGRSE